MSKPDCGASSAQARELALATLHFIQSKLSHPVNPKLAIVCGSGIGVLADDVTDKQVVRFGDIPNFPVTTVEGHPGAFVFGQLNGVEVVIMQV
jgi:purine-nucleoside phosphorylase